jgi:hypothetical protein
MICVNCSELSASITAMASNLPRTELASVTPLIFLDCTISSEVPGFIVKSTNALIFFVRRSFVANSVSLLLEERDRSFGVDDVGVFLDYFVYKLVEGFKVWSF